MSEDKKAVAKIGSFTCKDPTPCCYFRNVSYVFKRGKQLLNVEDFCDDGEVSDVNRADLDGTMFLRSKSKHLGRFFKMSKLTQNPMWTFEDGAAMLLGKDNQLGLDYLTFRHPAYKKSIGMLVDELFRSGDKSAQEAARILPTDYSISAPFASCIRRDGRMKLSESDWSEAARNCFKKNLAKFLVNNYEEALKHLSSYMPPRNAAKSIGFFDMFPDGSQYKKGEDFYVPESLAFSTLPQSENLWARKNKYAIKKAWLESGALEANFRWFLDNCKAYDNNETFYNAFLRGACSVHTEAYRLNNADPTLNDLSKGFNKCVEEGLFKKSRVVSYERPDGSFFSGNLRDQEYSRALRKLNPGAFGTLLKKRPMFPGPNATFSTPFILLFRLLLGPAEEKPSGFPSSNKKTLERYNRVISRNAGLNSTIITFDRKTSEQFITDNIELVLSLFPDEIKEMLNGLLRSVVASRFGPRVVKGLLSGTAATTFINCVVGLFEMIRCVTAAAYGRIEDDKFCEVCNLIFDNLLRDGDEIEVNGMKVLPNLGTDDQIFYCFTQKDLKVIEDNIASSKIFDEKYSLNGELTEQATVFGLNFTLQYVEVSKVLGLSKIWLFEKDKLGDKIAVKMASRYSLLIDYYDLLKFIHQKNGLGSITSYSVGAENYFRQLAKFKFLGFSDLWNEHSPTDKIIMGRYLEKLGIDPVQFIDKYSVEEMEPFVKLIGEKVRSFK